MRKIRAIALLLAAILILGLLPAGVLAAGEEIRISTAQELMELSDKCRLDSWSADKKVVLLCDIDLSGAEFQPIPSFGGTFDGAGYTVKGLQLLDGRTGVGGLFRYIQSTGTVSNLNVEGVIDPGTNAESFGGIAGENSGSIVNCSFSGRVSGSSDIGGIVGLNTASGEIKSCRSLAIVSGEHYTGGIAGRNLGSIISCTNLGAVNTTNPELETGALDIDWEHLNSAENVNTHTDTGGIAGYSQGSLEFCVNRGNVGYPHVGYNVGGIAGRHAGYMVSCRNFGLVNGRKDVGGVVGQLVPSIELQFSSSGLNELQAEMDTLQGLLDDMIGDFQGTSDEISGILSDAGAYLESAGKSAGLLGDALVGFVDGNIENVNNLADTAAAYALRLAAAAGHAEDCLGSISAAMEHLADFVSALERSGDEMAEILDDASYAIEKMGNAQASLTGAIGLCRSAVIELNSYFEELGGEIDGAISDALPELDNIGQLGSGSAGDTENGEEGETGDETQDTSEPGNMGDLTEILPLPEQEDIDRIVGEVEAGFEEFAAMLKSVGGKLDSAVDLLSDVSYYVDDAVENGLLPAMDKLSDFSAELEDLTAPLESAVQELGQASDHLGKGAGELADILADLGREDTDILQGLGDDFVAEADRMDAALAGLSGQMEKLNTAMSGGTSLVTEDLRLINDQFFRVMDSFMNLLEGSQSQQTIYEDMSEEELFSARNGKVEKCENRGAAEGDVNVGGIVGTMAIEYDLDPEEDISVSGPTNGTFRYFTNAVLLDSANFSSVKVKKNCAGGCVGYMDLGVVYGCENYGEVASISGDYTGGIAGRSAAAIRKCWNLSALSGGDYLGGIAGSGTDISSCRSIARFNAAGGWTGAIAGELLGEAKENYFVGAGQGGIDGVSYAGKAEPQEYEDFINAEGIPGEFMDFKLTFATETVLVKSLSFDYGSSIDPTEIPEVPKRVGYVGQWERYDFSNLTFSDTVNAIYTAYDTVIAVDEQVGKRPVVLLEGSFLPGTKPVFAPCEDSPDGSIEAWSVRAEGSTEDNFTVRYLMPGKADSFSVYVLGNKGWKQVETYTDGSYIMFETEGKSVSFAAVEVSKEPPVVPIALTCALGAVLIALVLILSLRTRKRKKAKK